MKLTSKHLRKCFHIKYLIHTVKISISKILDLNLYLKLCQVFLFKKICQRLNITKIVMI